MATRTTERIGVRQLKNEATKVIRRVREEGAVYVVTVNGAPVAVIRPLTEEDQEAERQRAIDEWLAGLDEVAAEISKYWPEGVTAAEAVAEQRREL